MKFLKNLKKWYQGKYIPPQRPDPNSPIIFGLGHYEQPLLAKLIGVLSRFYLKNWKWIISTTASVFGVLIKLP